MRTLEIVHRTRYEYSEPVSLGDHRLMFRPRDSHDLRLLRTGLVIEPAARVRWIHDPFGNSIAIASFEGTTQALELVSKIQLEHFGVPPELPAIEEFARTLPFSYAAEEAPDLARYIERAYPDPNSIVGLWTKQFMDGEGGNDTFELLKRLCLGIQQKLTYAMRFEIGTQVPATTLESGGGTCRDYALLMIECCRSLGLAARFITGYLYDPALDTAPGDATSHAYPHAWMEVYLPGAGWVEFDPTNGIIGSERLIRVAVARDPEQAMPIKGTFTGSADVTVNASVDVQVNTLTPEPLGDTAVSLEPQPSQAHVQLPGPPPAPAAPQPPAAAVTGRILSTPPLTS
jgi:transglutaminase-like putative cysteine protease